MLPFSPFLLFVLPEVMSCLASSCAKYLSLILPTLPETLSMHFPVQLFLETLCSELSFSSDSPARPLGWQHTVSPAFAAAGVLPFSWGGACFQNPIHAFLLYSCWGGSLCGYKWRYKDGSPVEITTIATLNALVSWKCSSDPDWLPCMFWQPLYFYFLDLLVSSFTRLFMEHIHVRFIEERHTGGKLFEMCISLVALQSWSRVWLLVTSWTAAL